MLSKTLYNLHIYNDADYRKFEFSCLQVLISNVNTRLQRIINRFLKNPGLSVASDARNVVRPKQGRLKM